MVVKTFFVKKDFFMILINILSFFFLGKFDHVLYCEHLVSAYTNVISYVYIKILAFKAETSSTKPSVEFWDKFLFSARPV